MIVELQAEDRWHAIDELIFSLVNEEKISPEHGKPISVAIKQRESAMSTGIGFGIAIPHASTELVSDVVSTEGRSKKGIDFGSLDGKPVHRVYLFLVPKGQFQKQVNTLANIAKLVHKADFREDLE